jgi:hypothetical protein
VSPDYIAEFRWEGQKRRRSPLANLLHIEKFERIPGNVTIEKRKGWKCETVREKRVTNWVDHMKFAQELNLLMALSAGLIA